MQHAEKGKKGSQTQISDIPTQTKKSPKSLREKKKSSTYKLKRNLNYTEKPELHLTNTYIQKEEGKKTNIKSSPLS